MNEPQNLKVKRSALSVERSGGAGCVESSSLVSSDAPWPGLASFTEEQSGFFHGRDEEIRALARLMERKALTVLFGQSGLGKSSLLQAGVFPRLRAASFCPIYIRLDHAEGASTPAEQVKTMVAVATAHVGTWTKPGIAKPAESLWEFFHHRDDRLVDASGRTIVPVLVFDQFEELFTLGAAAGAQRDRAVAFMSELAELVENRPSEKLVERLDQSSDEMDAFDFSRTDYRVCISLREDYLPHLEGLKTIMPALMENRMRLTRMTGTQALDAVLKPGGSLVTPEVARAIVEFVSGARGGSVERLAELDVEPPLLSVICRALNERRRALGQAQITADLVTGNRREILTDFYERSVADLPEEMRRFVEDKLLTKSGFRDNLALETALEEPGVTRPVIDTLVSRRLLRIEDRIGTQRVELTHDVLADVVRASRDVRQQRLVLEQAAQRETRALAEAARRSRRMRLAIGGLTLAVLALSVGAVFGIRAQRRAADQASRIDFAYGNQLLEQGRVSEGLAYLVRAGEANPASSAIATRLVSALAYRPLPLPLGNGLPHSKSSVILGLSPDGKRIATASNDGGSRVWDIATGTLVAAPMQVAGILKGAAYSPDGTRLATAATEGGVQLWDAATGTPIGPPVALASAGFAIAFSPDSRWLAAGSHEGIVQLVDARTGQKKATLQFPEPTWVSNIDFNAAGTALLATGFSRHWGVWSVPSGEPLTPVHRDAQNQVNYGIFSPDGTKVVLCDMGGAQVWDWAGGTKVGERIQHTTRCDYAEFSRDGTQLLVLAVTDSSLTDLKTGQLRQRFAGAGRVATFGRTVKIPRLSADARRVAIASGGSVRIYDTGTGSAVSDPVRIAGRPSLLLSPRGDELWVCSPDAAVRRWAVSGHPAEPLRVPKPPNSFTARPTTDRTKVAIVTPDRLEFREMDTGRLSGQPVKFPVRLGRAWGGTPRDQPGEEFQPVTTEAGDIEIWDLRDPSAIVRHSLGINEPAETRARIVFPSFDKKFSILRHQGELSVWDNATGKKVAGPIEHRIGLGSRFLTSRDNRLLAAGDTTGAVRVWDIHAAKLLHTFSLHRSQIVSLEFSPDGDRLISLDISGLLLVHDLRSGSLVLDQIELPETVYDVQFSPNGKRLLLGRSLGHFGYLLDAATGRIVGEPLAGKNALAGSDFDPTGSRVATSSYDDAVRVWDVETSQLVAEPMRYGQVGGSPVFSHDGRFVQAHNTQLGTYFVFAVPTAPPGARVPEWLLRLGTVVAAGRITAGGTFQDVPPPSGALARLKTELEALPDDSPYVKWGRWFLADAAKRTISPEHTVTAAEMAALSELAKE